MHSPLRTLWLEALGTPGDEDFPRSLRRVGELELPLCHGELYLQHCGPRTCQKLLILFPRRPPAPRPAVVIPFYHPDGMVGFDLATGQPLPRYAGISMALDLAGRGFITATADAYPFHFSLDDPLLQTTPFRCDFSRYEDFNSWQRAGERLQNEYPAWTGIGKLTADTRLLVDALCADPRVDAGRIGMAGHSLGGKMAFYAGCLDKRVQAILASDFGIGWEQTNWKDVWYWGQKAEIMRQAGRSHAELLTLGGGKPFMLLAGQYDNAESGSIMQQAHGYDNAPGRRILLNHASGHRPPPEALTRGYDFLAEHLGS